MFSVSRWWLLAAVMAVLFTAACGGSTSSLDNGLAAGNGPAEVEQSTGLPGIPHESGDPVRGVSAGEGTATVLGKDFFLMQNGVVDGNALRLDSFEGEGGAAYGMYQVEGLSGKKPLVLTCETAPDLEEHFFVGVANYTDMAWQWFGPYGLPDAVVDLSESQDKYITELGNFYFLVLTESGDGATHQQATLSYRDSDPIGDDDLPGAPFDLSASDGSFADGVQVNWFGGEGANVFEVWRRLNDAQGEDAWTLVAEVEGHEYFDTNVDTGIKYRYKVRARNEHGHSAFSNSDSGFAGEGGGTDWCPAELVASDGTSADWVELNWWPGAGDVHHFKIWRRVDGGGEFSPIAQTDDHFYKDTTAEAGVWYIYKVERLGEGESCFSNTDGGYRAGTQDDWCPSELWASDGTYAEGVKLEWNGGIGDGTFKVMRRSDPLADFQQIGTTVEPSFFDANTDVGVEYEYIVYKFVENQNCHTNVDSGWRGQQGDGWCPSDMVASDGTSSDGVWLEWNKGTGNGNFSVWRRVVESGTEFALVEDGITTGSFLDATAEPGVHYNYFVRKHLEAETCDTNFDVGWRADGQSDWCPSGLVATDGTYTDKVRLEWNPGAGDGSFNVWRKRDGEGFQWILLGNTPNADWNDSADIDAGVVYLYKVVKLGVDNECASNIDSGFMGTGDPMG